MMGGKDIETVIIGAVNGSGLVSPSAVFVSDDFPTGKVTAERVVIIVKESQRSPIFYNGFVEVNFCVPDKDGRADHGRLQELETSAVNYFSDDVVGDYDGTTYRYGIYAHGLHRDEELGCHYANIRLLFETLNVR